MIPIAFNSVPALMDKRTLAANLSHSKIDHHVVVL